MTMQWPGNDLTKLFETDEQGRRAIFGARFGNLNPFQQRYSQSLYEPTFNKYLGEMGKSLLMGQAPQQSFTDYLSQNFDPQRELLKGPQSDTTRLLGQGTRYNLNPYRGY